MKTLSHVRNAIYSQPWMITLDGLDLICGIVESNLVGQIPPEEFTAQTSPGMARKKSDFEIINGVAVIPIMGPIIPRANLFSNISGAASYEKISSMLNAALVRDDVSAIVFHADSPGGSVTGCFECATEIHEAVKTSEKPIVGAIDGRGCSACYAILSQCGAVFCTEGSVVGSIGVIARMDNNDRAEKNAGNDVMVFRSAELKAPGTGPMTPNQTVALHRQLMKFDSMFDDAVKRGRPAIDIEAVSNGDTWIGIDAEQIGLVDEVRTLDEVVAMYQEKVLH